MRGTTLAKTITKRSHCAVIDTDGLRPPYVNFDDDHQNQTALNIGGLPLDATVNAYAVIPCDAVRTGKNPLGIPMGTTARIRNVNTGACVDGVVGDCGDSESDGCKVKGYGEMSMAATKAIGVYLGPESVEAHDPTEIVFGAAADPENCKPAPPLPPWATRSPTTKVCNVLLPPYSAKGDNATEDTAAVRSALAACSGGIVLLPAGKVFLLRPIELPSHTELRIEGDIQVGQGDTFSCCRLCSHMELGKSPLQLTGVTAN